MLAAPHTRAAASSSAAASPRTLLLQRPAAPRVAHAAPRLPRRNRPAAPVAATISAAQKKAFSSFQSMIKESEEPVLVEFYATWCGPCQMMGQILDEVAPTMRNRVRFVKVDTERYPGVASQYHIGALPTLVLFRNGNPVDRIEGVIMGQDLRNRLEYLLAKH